MTDPEVLREFIHKYSFAILVTTDGQSDHPPLATHLPMLLTVESDGTMFLTGHVARANPQWKVASGRPALAVFHGPHAYISPSWYGDKNVVPTWNYLAVHISGRLEIQQEPEQLEELVRNAVTLYESRSAKPWSADSTDAGYLRQLTNAIVGLRMTVDRMEGCWKLNQHHPDERRQGTIEGLLQRGTPDDLEIARLMQNPPQRA